MTKSITVTGASDDVIVLDGDAKDEFDYDTGSDGARLTFSDGTVLWARFGEFSLTTFWRITVDTPGNAHTNRQEAPIHNLDRDYTDSVTVTGDLAWVEIDDDGGRGPRRIDL